MQPPDSAAAPLEVRALTHFYGEHRVCDVLSFALAAGEIACLLGPSGCGKTTPAPYRWLEPLTAARSS
jgi:ABC-type Fe3+/spermidine/putrescine transport system ATPase subunit